MQILVAYLLQAACNLLIGLLLLRFWQTFERRYLREWGWSWLALAAYHVLAAAGMELGELAPEQVVLSTLLSALTLVAGYWQLAWLMQGILDLARSVRLPARTFHMVLAALAATAVLQTLGTIPAGDLRRFLRFGLRCLVAAGVLGAAAGVVRHRARRPGGVGPSLLVGALALYGLDQIYLFFVLLRPSWPYNGMIDLLLQAGVGLGMTVWLLEDEHRRELEATGALRQSEARLHAAFDHLPLDFWVCDTEGRCILQNTSSVRRWGNLVGIKPADTGLPADLALRWEEATHRALAGEIITGELEYNFGGEKHYFYALLAPIRDGDRIHGALGLSMDISDRKRAELALRESEIRQRLAIDMLGLGSWEVEAASRRAVLSERARVCWGVSADEAVNRDVLISRCHPDDRAVLAAAVARAEDPAGNGEFSSECRVVWPDGSVRWLAARGRAFFEGDGAKRRHVRSIGVVQDVTSRRQAEEERRRLEAKVQEAQRLESLGVLAGGIAHDFNNLLTSIVGNTEMALASLPAVHPVRDSIQRVRGAAGRAAELTQQMLAYSGKGRFVVSRVDLSGLVRDVMNLLQVSLPKGCTLDCRLAGDLPPVSGDVTQLRQVVVNLVLNAGEAMSEGGGVVRIRTAVHDCPQGAFIGAVLGEDLPAGRYVSLEVTDTGCGMSPETLVRIFDPFFTTKFTGRGLGLAAVLGIMRSHHGAIRVSSVSGGGSTFEVFFPAAEPAPIAVAPAAPVPAATAAPAARDTVLVVDDEPHVRDVARRLLQQMGLQVLLAGDGPAAVETYRTHNGAIGAILLDLHLPRMDGMETLRQLRLLNARAVVILTSGYSLQENADGLDQLGPVAFLAKPFQLDELANAVRAALATG